MEQPSGSRPDLKHSDVDNLVVIQRGDMALAACVPVSVGCDLDVEVL